MFKQKTAYEMRISDWSSDVCSSDLVGAGQAEVGGCPQIAGAIMQQCADRVAGQRRGHRRVVLDPLQRSVAGAISQQIGRASCRERVCQSVYISVVAVSLNKQKQ